MPRATGTGRFVPCASRRRRSGLGHQLGLAVAGLLIVVGSLVGWNLIVDPPADRGPSEPRRLGHPGRAARGGPPRERRRAPADRGPLHRSSRTRTFLADLPGPGPRGRRRPGPPRRASRHGGRAELRLPRRRGPSSPNTAQLVGPGAPRGRQPTPGDGASRTSSSGSTRRSGAELRRRQAALETIAGRTSVLGPRRWSRPRSSGSRSAPSRCSGWRARSISSARPHESGRRGSSPSR